MFGIALGNRAFKARKAFLEKKLHFYQTDQFFVWHNFFCGWNHFPSFTFDVRVLDHFLGWNWCNHTILESHKLESYRFQEGGWWNPRILN
jgi:hypothetical protein